VFQRKNATIQRVKHACESKRVAGHKAHLRISAALPRDTNNHSLKLRNLTGARLGQTRPHAHETYVQHHRLRNRLVGNVCTETAVQQPTQ